MFERKELPSSDCDINVDLSNSEIVVPSNTHHDFWKLKDSIDEFEKRIAPFYKDDDNAQVAISAWREVCNQLVVANTSSSKQVASMLAANLNAMRFDMPGKDQSDLNMTILVNAATQLDACESAHKFKKCLGVAFATTAFMLIGMTITVGLLGGAAAVPGAVSLLTYYLAKGALTEKAAKLAFLMCGPTLISGAVGYFGSKAALFSPSPIAQSLAQAKEVTTHLINMKR